jgi:antitoxin MazE
MEARVSRATVGKWGKSLAIRLPLGIARAAGLSDGELVEIEENHGEIVIRRPLAEVRADAQAAAEEIIDESRNHPLSDIIIRELIDEGRRE